MEWTVTYVLSQFFTILMYALLGVTYYSKKRKTILILSFLSNTSCGISYFLLNAWSGVAMCILAMFRETVYLIDEKKNGKRDYINKFDIVFLIILYTIAIISAVYTYEGFLSLLSIIATMMYTFSIWQKSTKVYKIFGIPIGVSWITYNAYVKNLFGIILESLILICSVTGYILEIKRKKEKKKKSLKQKNWNNLHSLFEKFKK